jgi:serine/threonine protein kinase
MTNPGPNPIDDAGAGSEEQRLGELINEFFDRRESGEKLSEEDFLAQHPDEAEQLREHLCGLDLLEALGESSARRTQSRSDVHANGSPVSMRPPASTPVPNIPGYEILKQIGRGGMGIVFKAVQLSTKRIVALKLLLEGPYASETSRKRFEREIALAAQLRHPNIIPIYDSGVSGDNMYYAMEYVYGLPLNDYLAAHRLSMEDVLSLYIKVCAAVSHAHLRGVVHRDLKPSNILVDGDGEPHVLDFGLAKAGTLADTTTSVSAQVVGTPAYMSPEQAGGDPGGVDIRTDVYSLGVMLYESLCGAMPYETSGSMGRILNNIANVEPAPPSKLNPKIDADVTAIMLKALSKGKDERFQSVDALSGDLRRYLAGEPITAKPTSGFYLLRKVLYKYRLPVGLVAILTISLSTTAIMYHFLRSSRVEAQQARKQAEVLAEQVTRKEAERQEAEQGRVQADSARIKAETAQRDYEWLVKTMDPEFAKKVEPVAQALGKSLSRGEDAAVAAARLAGELLSGELEQSDAQRGMRKQDFVPDPNAPLVSGRPPWASEKPRTETMRTAEERRNLLVLEALARRARDLAMQPAASQPTSGAAGDAITTAESPQATQPAEAFSTVQPSPASQSAPGAAG